MTVGGAFLALSAVFWWRDRPALVAATAILATFFVLGALAVPARMGLVYRIWMRMALAISRVTTPVLMGIIFFLVITSFGLVARVLGHRPLTRRSRESAWIARDAGARRSDLRRQF